MTPEAALHPTRVLDSVVIGAGQAGLSASHHLLRLGIDHLVLDANVAAGGAWEHRWDALTMADVHGVSELPGTDKPVAAPRDPANVAVPQYFEAYEAAFGLPVVRPATVRAVTRSAEGFLVEATLPSGRVQLRARTLVNATGTWTRPFVPTYPGQAGFAGTQLHTRDFPGPEFFDGRRTLVVGGGASAVQFLGLLAPRVGAENLVWTTRREPVWLDQEFTPELGSQIVAKVSERARAGLPTRSVVSYTGLFLREQEQQALALGVYDSRRPMFDRIEPDGVRWDQPPPGAPAFEAVDVILWATGFRAAVDHLAGLRLRSARGGIQLADDETTAVADPRVQLVGYGPSASTIGANRAGRRAALGVRRALQQADLQQPDQRRLSA